MTGIPQLNGDLVTVENTTTIKFYQGEKIHGAVLDDDGEGETICGLEVCIGYNAAHTVFFTEYCKKCERVASKQCSARAGTLAKKQAQRNG